MLLSDVCLSIAYIGPKSRTERPRKTKIGIEVAHVTRDSTPRSRSKVKVTRPLYSPPCWRVRQLHSGGRGNVLAVRNCCYVAVCSAARAASAPMDREEGRGHIVSPRAQLVEDRIRAHKAARASFYTGPPYDPRAPIGNISVCPRLHSRD